LNPSLPRFEGELDHFLSAAPWLVDGKRLSLKFGLVARRQFLQCSPTESD